MLHQNHERLKKRGKESTYIGQKMVMKIVGIDPSCPNGHFMCEWSQPRSLVQGIQVSLKIQVPL